MKNKKESKEIERDIKKEIEQDLEKDIYTEEGINSFLEDDSISAEEQGFMMGYLAA